ncbi:single-stranded DNA-binding protein, partial [bacterium]|nr:single-stranded DNA-binding protein [bacterium]
MAFKDLKRKKLSTLTAEMDKLNERNSSFDNSDDNLWRPKLDASNTGYAVLRFLPGPDVDGDESLPWVRVFDHGFKGPTGKWYIE